MHYSLQRYSQGWNKTKIIISRLQNWNSNNRLGHFCVLAPKLSTGKERVHASADIIFFLFSRQTLDKLKELARVTVAFAPVGNKTVRMTWRCGVLMRSGHDVVAIEWRRIDSTAPEWAEIWYDLTLRDTCYKLTEILPLILAHQNCIDQTTCI